MSFISPLYRHRLLWRLVVVLIPTAVITMMAGSWLLGELRSDAQRLSEPAKAELTAYARDAQRAWREGGETGVAAWLAYMREREVGDIAVVDSRDQSLSGIPLTASERGGLRFQRSLRSGMSFRYGKRMPYVGIPFPDNAEDGRLLIQLPPRLRPGGYWPYLETVLLILIPGLSSFALGLLLFWRVRVPLRALQKQVLAFKDDTRARVDPPLSDRRDEFGDLARSFNRMADQVSAMLATQRQLLNDMSHELRTPLSRLSVALESRMDETALRDRVSAELVRMQALVDDTLALGWQDTAVEKDQLQPLSVVALWDLVIDNACFESGWEKWRFPCLLANEATIKGHLNILAQVFENLVRNAIRHSPADGQIVLDGVCEGGNWHLTLTDQGPGVPVSSLENIFDPFVRLDAARKESGFGLGLSIALRAVRRLEGDMWAENATPGLKIHIRLPASPPV